MSKEALSFYLIIFCVSGWLIQGSNTSKKEPDRVPCSFMFLRTPLPSSCHQTQFWSKWKASPHRARSYPTYSVIDWTHFASPWTHIMVHWNSVLVGHHEQYTQGQQGTADTHITNIFSTHTHDPLFHQISLQKRTTGSKVKLLRRSRRWQQGIKPKCWSFLSVGLCITRQIAHPWSWSWGTFLFILQHLLSIRYLWKKWMRQADKVPSLKSLRGSLGDCYVHVSNRRVTCLAPKMILKVSREYLALLGYALSPKVQLLELNREKYRICTAET